MTGAAIFLAVFGSIYEIFSHGVYSYFMIYAFLIPLVLGVLPYGWLLYKRAHPPRIVLQLWNFGIAAFSVGSLIKGVLEIYGTTNLLWWFYPVIGALCFAGVGLALLKGRMENA